MKPAYIAIDLGASSGRVIIGSFSAEEGLRLDVTSRFTNGFRKAAGHDRWDLEALWSGIVTGLSKAAKLAKERGLLIKSVGCDTWGVDYGLFSREGHLIEEPIAYRDNRTEGVQEQLFRRCPKAVVYEKTGIQFMPFNTLFQLYAHVHSQEWPSDATTLLMMPDIVHYRLTGKMSGEYTIATTAQLVNARSKEWDMDLMQKAGLPAHIFPSLVHPGSDLGLLDIEIQERTHLPETTRVVVPASHDTGSAVIGTPLAEGWAYLSSGTWSLLGLELNEPCLTPAALEHNFTNEGGAYGSIRFLQNVMGLWLLESCRREWLAEGVVLPYEDLLARMVALGTVPGELDPDALEFLNPDSMRAAIASHLEKKGMAPVTEQAALSRLILQSLAKKYAKVVKELAFITGKTIKGIHIVGGGSQNRLLNQMTADASGLPVIAGPVEATALGNLVVQAIADKQFSSLKEAREFIGAHEKLERFEPKE